jgi:lipopolysaccharide export system protein LptC
MTWRRTLTLLLLLAALVTGWSAWRQRANDVAVQADSTRSDYVLRDFELVSLDGQGKEAFTLRAPELARNPKDGTMRLQTPVFLLPDKDGHYWNVRSKTGWVSADHDELRLRGDVHARTAPESGREMWMNTEQLNVFPETETATSAVPVTITQPGITMTGSGMLADLAGSNIKFDDKVKTRYVPTRR